MTVFHVKWSDFWKRKKYEIISTLWLCEKRYNFETNKKGCIQIWCDILKSDFEIMLKFQSCNFWTYWEITCQRLLRPGRAGLGRLITDFDYMVKKIFLFYEPYKKINNSQYMALFKSPMWLWKRTLDCQLAPLRFTSLAKYFLQTDGKTYLKSPCELG